MKKIYEAHHGELQTRGRCKNCEMEGGEESFYRQGRKWKDGKRQYLSGLCKSCYYQAHKPHKAYSYGKTKVTPEERMAMIDTAPPDCPICKEPLKNRKPVIDHCHDTDKIRGVICSQCNTGIGSLGDNPENCLRAAEWLKKES